MKTPALRSIVAACALLASACSSAGNALPVTSRSTDDSAVSPGSYIKHVVIVVQENRTFDNIFAGFPGTDRPACGATPMCGYTIGGTPVPRPCCPSPLGEGSTPCADP